MHSQTHRLTNNLNTRRLLPLQWRRHKNSINQLKKIIITNTIFENSKKLQKKFAIKTKFNRPIFPQFLKVRLDPPVNFFRNVGVELFIGQLHQTNNIKDPTGKLKISQQD